MTALNPSNAPAKRAFTVDEAAALLSVGRVTLYELINSGELRSVKLRACRRIPADAIDELLRGGNHG